jgi:hypothetical protein
MRAGKVLRVALIAALVAAGGIAAFVGWWKLAPRATPEGQPPLATISSAAEIRDVFNSRPETTTILALLSPT